LPPPPGALVRSVIPDSSNALPVLPGYEIARELGRGGMGVVYAARHQALKRAVALKVIRDGAFAGKEEVARFRAEAWDRIRPRRPTTLVATAGTPTTLAVLDLGLLAYDPGRVHGHRLSAVAIARLTERLAALPLAERARIPGLEPGRADVIVPGAVVLAAALAGLGLPAATVSDAGLREGILLDAVGWRPSPPPPRA